LLINVAKSHEEDELLGLPLILKLWMKQDLAFSVADYV